MTDNIENSQSAPNRMMKLQTLTPLVQEINCLDLKKISDVCIKQIPKLVDARLASLYLLEDQSDMLQLLGHNHPFLINNIVSLNQNPPSPMVTAARTKKLLQIDDIDKFDKPIIRQAQRQFSQNYQTKSCLVAPLICQGRVVGVLNLADRIGQDSFSEEDIAVVELFRQLVGASIGNIKLFEKIQYQARTDGLTGLVNHRTFYDILEREQNRAQRYGGQVSIIMADIDNLKPINDNYGHRAGDYAIRYVSRKITECIREIDIAARYGGDEFSVILPNTSLADALVVSQRMVKEISQSPINWENNYLNVSVSIGVGQYDASSCPQDIARSADEALYCAKQAGKNTVKVYDPSLKNAEQACSNP